jgi:hypothetical protein
VTNLLKSSQVKTTLFISKEQISLAACRQFDSQLIIKLDQNPLGLLPVVVYSLERGDTIAAPKPFLPDCANLQPAPNCAH